MIFQVPVVCLPRMWHKKRVVRLNPELVAHAVAAALAEDIGSGDATTIATVPPTTRAKALMRAREPLIVCGLSFAREAFQQLDPTLRLEALLPDGHRAGSGETILTVEGPARAILTAERVALNFMQRLSGVATLTSLFVEAIRGTRASVLDTRKTTPGWRAFEKYAVSCGGGANHRFGLYDLILIKDNHLAALADATPNAIQAAVRQARAAYPELKVEVETDTLEQVAQAVEARADIILLDNMSLAMLREAVRMVDGRAKTEASGGVNLQTIRSIAETGVDLISVGALTHSARSVDIGLDFQ